MAAASLSKRQSRHQWQAPECYAIVGFARRHSAKIFFKNSFPILAIAATIENIECKRAISSVVERLPYKQDVTGSSPVSPIFGKSLS